MKATLFFDGACKGNPGPAAGGAILALEAGDGTEPPIFQQHKGVELTVVYDSSSAKLVSWKAMVAVHSKPFTGTNNEAEYQGLLVGLQEALSRGILHLTVYGDSKLVVEQVNGRWACNKPHLGRLRKQAWDLLHQFDLWTLAWVPREKNKEADKAANAALDSQP